MTNKARRRCAQRRSWCSGLTLPHANTLSPTTELVSLVVVEFVHRFVPMPSTKLMGIRMGKTTHARGMKMTRRVLRYLMKKYASRPHLLMIARSGTPIRPVTRAHGARGGGSLQKVSAVTLSRQVGKSSKWNRLTHVLSRSGTRKVFGLYILASLFLSKRNRPICTPATAAETARDARNSSKPYPE